AGCFVSQMGFIRRRGFIVDRLTGDSREARLQFGLQAWIRFPDHVIAEKIASGIGPGCRPLLEQADPEAATGNIFGTQMDTGNGRAVFFTLLLKRRRGRGEEVSGRTGSLPTRD